MYTSDWALWIHFLSVKQSRGNRHHQDSGWLIKPDLGNRQNQDFKRTLGSLYNKNQNFLDGLSIGFHGEWHLYILHVHTSEVAEETAQTSRNDRFRAKLCSFHSLHAQEGHGEQRSLNIS